MREYKTFYNHDDTQHRDRVLNDAAREGWRLITCYRDDVRMAFVMERGEDDDEG